MGSLTEQHCEACRGQVPPATADEVAAFLEQLPDWEIVVVDGIGRLTRRFAFRNFRQALDFSTRVGELAEVEGHHPALLTEWGSVTVQWWTHRIGGLHRNDFIMAAKTDALLAAGTDPTGHC